MLWITNFQIGIPCLLVQNFRVLLRPLCVSVLVHVLLFGNAYTDANSTIQIYMRCTDDQKKDGVENIQTSDFYLEQSGKSEVCISSNHYIGDNHFESVHDDEKRSNEMEEEFDKAFEAIDKIIDLPDEAVRSSNAHTVIIELSETGRDLLKEFTSHFRELYLVVDGLVITNLVTHKPINSGKIHLVELDTQIYTELKKVMNR